MVVQAPDAYKNIPAPKVFIGGSIEMGAAEQWQDKVIKALDGYNVVLLNPRRDNWDSSWEQDINNIPFNQQVNWELDGLYDASMVLFYFDPNTKSPITLMELGLMAGVKEHIIVCCPKGFWRKGNVDIVCDRFGIKQVDTIGDLVLAAENMLVTNLL